MKSTLNEDKRWLNVMSQGGTREGVYRGIVLEDRYLRLERKSFPINPKVLDLVFILLITFCHKILKDLP